MKKFAVENNENEQDIRNESVAQLDRLTAVGDNLYPEQYLASVFKNLTKCKVIIQRLTE
jgi:hypothetical protein